MYKGILQGRKTGSKHENDMDIYFYKPSSTIIYIEKNVLIFILMFIINKYFITNLFSKLLILCLINKIFNDIMGILIYYLMKVQENSRHDYKPLVRVELNFPLIICNLSFISKSRRLLIVPVRLPVLTPGHSFESRTQIQTADSAPFLLK